MIATASRTAVASDADARGERGARLAISSSSAPHISGSTTGTTIQCVMLPPAPGTAIGPDCGRCSS